MDTEITKLIKNFNHKLWLTTLNIPFYETGRNLGKNWIGIDCPFCIEGDTGGHMGINTYHKGIHCWKCKTSGSIIKLIKKYNIDYKNTLLRFQGKEIHVDLIPKNDRIYAKTCTLPERATPTILPLHKHYLLSRGFDPAQLYNDYQLLSTGVDVDWGYRLIIPMYYGQKLMTFVGRDVSGKAKIRYKAETIEKSVVDAKGTIFNINSATDRLILVEGVFDAMKLGKSCGSIMGTEFDDRQIQMIIKSNIKQVFILFDNDIAGKQAAQKYGNALNSFVETEILTLPESVSDPAELSSDDINILRKQVFGKIY